MPNTTARPTILKFNIGSLMVGRTVKTAQFTRALRNHFVKMDIPDGMEGYCNLQYRIKEVNSDKKTVLLTYKISAMNYVDVEWPISALNESFGIKI